MKPTIGVLELMTFHHEVLIAFCRHVIDLKLESIVIAPSQGIQKAINRHAASSFASLTKQAREQGTRFDLEQANNIDDIKSLLKPCQALFLGTFPPSPSNSKIKRLRNHSVYSKQGQAIDLIKTALAQDKRVYVVIHNPSVDGKSLVTSLGAA